MNDTKKSAETATANRKTKLFTAEERAAMMARVNEQKAEARRGSLADKAAAEEADVLAKIAEMPKSDRVMAERIHAVVKANAPVLAPKLWYGMPAYARDGKLICFFKAADKFKVRYATFGFEEAAHLDDGDMWATSWALKRLTPAEEARIGELVKKAAS